MEQFISALEERAAETDFSGVVRVDRGSEVALNQAHGFAHRGFEVPNTVETRFAIASGGKGFTALAVMSLVSDGSLSLQTTARSILGDDLPLIADDVTVEHLLAHTSGIGDYLDEEDEEMDLADYLMKQPIQNLDSTEAFVVELDGYPTKFQAGQRFSYCNAGYIVLALLAERVSGVGYHELVHERVIGPAGMEATAFLRSDEASDRMAVGYLDETGMRSNIFHLPVRGNGDGGVFTTAEDMSLFWRSLMSGEIVSPLVVAEMIKPHSVVPEEEARYGLGFWLGETGPTIKLVGGDSGVSFYSVHDPSTSTTATVLSNTTSGVWPLVRVIRGAIES